MMLVVTLLGRFDLRSAACIAILAMQILVLISLPARAADVYSDIEPYSTRIYVEGTIEDGDLQKIKNERDGRLIMELIVRSPGGNLLEALRIAEFVNDNLILVRAPEPSAVASDRTGDCIFRTKIPPKDQENCVCFSSCAIIWLSAPARQGSFIGVHRPRFDYSDYAGLTLPEAKKTYDQMVADLKTELVADGVDQNVLQEMMNTPSSDLKMLEYSEIKRVGEFKPFLDELLTAKCKESLDDHIKVEHYFDEYRRELTDWVQACVNRNKDSCPQRKEKLDWYKVNAPKRPTAFQKCRSDEYFRLLADSQKKEE